MSFAVKFYTAAQFSKRTNSTKRPAASITPTTYQCTLKEQTGLMDPTIRLKLAGGAAASPAGFVYCEIPAFGRYYFIRDYVNDGPLWDIQLTCDVLATYQTVIGASSRYVLRSSAASDGGIVDHMYPTTGGRQQITRTPPEGGAPFEPYGYGTYVLGIIGAGTGTASMGAVQYYAFDQAQLNTFFNTMFGDNQWLGVSQQALDPYLQKMLFNPFQYISSAMYFPFDATSLGTEVNTVKFGWWALQTSAYKLPKAPFFDPPATQIVIPKHPQAAARGGYLNCAPYSDYVFEFQPFGSWPVDTAILYGADTLQVKTTVDLISGIGRVNLLAYNGNTRLAMLPDMLAQVGVPIELAQISHDLATPLGSAAGAAVSAALGNPVGAIMGGISAIGSLIQGAAGSLERKGANGSLVAYYNELPSLRLNYFNIAPASTDELGAPLCQTRVIRTIPGYILCAEGDIDVPATDPERRAISGYLTGGFFYEV